MVLVRESIDDTTYTKCVAVTELIVAKQFVTELITLSVTELIIVLV